MSLISRLYDKTLVLASHKQAPAYLGVLSFSEAVFFPIPPDAMLIPMVLADKAKAWRLAALTTITSVSGGVLGYLIGTYMYESVGLWLVEFYRMENNFSVIQQWYREYGIWMIFAAGFLPIPYKVFTVASGVFSMALIPFVIASTLGRGIRFYLVAALAYWSVDSVNSLVRKYPYHIGWGVILVLVIGLVYWFYS